MKNSEFDANKNGFTSYTIKPTFKRPQTRFERLKATKVISVFKFVLYVTVGLILINYFNGV